MVKGKIRENNRLCKTIHFKRSRVVHTGIGEILVILKRFRLTLLLALLPACLLALASGACSSAPATSIPSSSWNTYVSENFAFSFAYPQDVSIEIQTDGPFQVVIFDDPDQPIYVRATWDYSPNDLLYFLDTPSNATTDIGDYQWQIYRLPDGYGDAVGTSPPVYALQMEVDSVLYAVVFFNQDALTSLQHRILSTFKTAR